MSDSLQAGLSKLGDYLSKPPERAPRGHCHHASHALAQPRPSHATCARCDLCRHHWRGAHDQEHLSQARPEPVGRARRILNSSSTLFKEHPLAKCAPRVIGPLQCCTVRVVRCLIVFLCVFRTGLHGGYTFCGLVGAGAVFHTSTRPVRILCLKDTYRSFYSSRLCLEMCDQREMGAKMRPRETPEESFKSI